MSALRRSAAVLSLALLAAACGPPRVSLVEGARHYDATDYDKVLARWTRENRLIAFTELHSVLSVTATFESWDFRWAYVARYARDHRLTPEQQQELLEKSLAEAKEQHTFYVALTGDDRRFSDLTRSDAAWVVRLADDKGNETAPLAIEAVRKPGPVEQVYFPYTTVFRRVFRIRFPAATEKGPSIAPDARQVVLRFSGPKGQSELRWDLEPSGARQHLD